MTDIPYLVTYLFTLAGVFPVAHGTTMSQDLGRPEPLLQGCSYRLRPVGRSPHLRLTTLFPINFGKLSPLSRGYQDLKRGSKQPPSSWMNWSGKGLSRPTHQLAFYGITTVVEAVTIVTKCSAEDEDHHPALTLCTDHLLDLHRAYRVGLEKQVPPLTYSGIDLLVLWTKRDPLTVSPKKEHRLSGVVILDHLNFDVPGFDEIRPDEMNYLLQFYVRDRLGDPFIVFRDHIQRAQREWLIKHEPGRAVLDSAIGAEVLFSAVLGLMLWEESLAGKLADEDAKKILRSNLACRVKNHFHTCLGGNWSKKGAEISDWYELIAKPRNRVVHAGYRPSVEEAQRSVAA